LEKVAKEQNFKKDSVNNNSNSGKNEKNDFLNGSFS